MGPRPQALGLPSGAARSHAPAHPFIPSLSSRLRRSGEGRVALIAVAILAIALPASAAEKWKPIFNGRNLDGWVPKINHHPLGENWRDTFQAKDGVLKVDYSQ